MRSNISIAAEPAYATLAPHPVAAFAAWFRVRLGGRARVDAGVVETWEADTPWPAGAVRRYRPTWEAVDVLRAASGNTYEGDGRAGLLAALAKWEVT